LPVFITIIFCVVKPLLHTIPLALSDERVTLPPVQKVVLPWAVITGFAGFAFTSIVATLDLATPPEFVHTAWY
jgi:hypothetical protein